MSLVWGQSLYPSVPGCPDLVDGDFRKITLDSATTEPLAISVAKDGRVFWVERGGNLLVHKPDTRKTVTAGKLDVRFEGEGGLLGVSLDPKFPANPFIYLYYTSPAGSDPEKSMNKLSRFSLAGDVLNLGTEKMILEVPYDFRRPHTGGAIRWDNAGNLYLSTGDNSGATGYFQSGAAGTAANTNDLRGKILRIHPEPDGRYTIPSGNLFPEGITGPDVGKTRPEIYVMGLRNPYRFDVDSFRDLVVWGEIGPDASTADPLQGPAGTEEFNVASAPGFFGWPFFVGKETYTDSKGVVVDPKAPVNASTRNTGLSQLPPAHAASIWYAKDKTESLPGFAARGMWAAIGGPVYRYDGNLPSATKMPPHFHGKWFITDFGKNWIKAVTFGERGEILQVHPVFTHIKIDRPLDLVAGPDGALYFAEYAGWRDRSAGTRISRIEYTGKCRPTTGFALDRKGRREGPDSKAYRLSDFNRGSLNIPEGMASLEIFDLQGSKVWEYRRSHAEHAISPAWPQELVDGVWLVRYLRNTKSVSGN